MPNAWIELINADGSDEHLELCNTALLEVQDVERVRTTKKILGILKQEDGLLTPAGVAKVDEMLHALEFFEA